VAVSNRRRHPPTRPRAGVVADDCDPVAQRQGAWFTIGTPGFARLHGGNLLPRRGHQVLVSVPAGGRDSRRSIKAKWREVAGAESLADVDRARLDQLPAGDRRVHSGVVSHGAHRAEAEAGTFVRFDGGRLLLPEEEA